MTCDTLITEIINSFNVQTMTISEIWNLNWAFLKGFRFRETLSTTSTTSYNHRSRVQVPTSKWYYMRLQIGISNNECSWSFFFWCKKKMKTVVSIPIWRFKIKHQICSSCFVVVWMSTCEPIYTMYSCSLVINIQHTCEK